jgi:hypothetical protein
VPADASRVLSRDNVAVVANEAHRALMWTHRLGGERMYLAALAAWRAADSQHQQCVPSSLVECAPSSLVECAPSSLVECAPSIVQISLSNGSAPTG